MLRVRADSVDTQEYSCEDGCPQQNFPVCGVDGEWYQNKCIAQCSGVAVDLLSRACKGEAADYIFVLQQQGTQIHPAVLDTPHPVACFSAELLMIIHNMSKTAERSVAASAAAARRPSRQWHHITCIRRSSKQRVVQAARHSLHSIAAAAI